jgi:hypothetical protein
MKLLIGLPDLSGNEPALRFAEELAELIEAGYAFVVDERGTFQLTRQGEVLAESGTGPDVFDGATHTLELLVQNGVLRGTVDGQVVAEASDPDPLPPGAATLATGISPVYLDVLALCTATGG